MSAVDTPTTPQRQDKPAAPAPADGEVRRRRGRLSGLQTPLLLSLPALLLLAALLGYPLVRMIQLSFQSFRLRQLLTGRAADWVGLDNYTRVLTDPTFWDVVRRSVLFTAASVTISVVAGLAIALLMRRVHRAVRLLMMVTMMFVWALPQLVQAQVFRWMVDADFGVANYLIDKLPGVDFQAHSWFVDSTQGWLVITTLVVWAGLPFLAITLNAGLTQVPTELIEAATVDGASPWQVLRKIILPILKPLLIIVTTLSVIWNFGLFTQTWVLRDSKPELEYQTLAIYSYVQAFGRSNYSLGSAVAVLTVLLLLGVMAFYIRQMFKIGEVD